MKKLIVFLGILLVITSFNSCSSSDDDENQNQEKIIGKWQLSQIFINNVDMQINECEKKMTIEVFENGTYIEKDFEYNDELTECLLYDSVNGTWESLGNSNYSMSGLNTISVKVTFKDNKMIAEYSEMDDGITFSIKTIFIADEDVTPDKIIGDWKLDQEFYDGVEMSLSDCDKMGTFKFLEDGFFLEQEFEDNETSTECIATPIKTRLWKNIGDSKYILYKIADDSEEEVKITFESNKMTVEVSLEEEGVIYMAKLIFIRVT